MLDAVHLALTLVWQIRRRSDREDRWERCWKIPRVRPQRRGLPCRRGGPFLPGGQVVRAAPDPLVRGGQRGTIHTVNPHAERMFGYDRAELHGKPLEQLMPE